MVYERKCVSCYCRLTEMEQGECCVVCEPDWYCKVGLFSSRVCELGTKGCEIRHEYQPKTKTPTRFQSE